MKCSYCNDVNQVNVKLCQLRSSYKDNWQNPRPICERCRKVLIGFFKYYKEAENVY